MDGILTRITALYTAFVIFLGSFAIIAEPKIPKASTESQLLSMEGVVEKKQLGNDVFVYDIGGYSYEERMTAITLQGIVAKQNTCMYILQSGADSTYLKEIEKSGKTLHYEKLSLASLIEKYKSYIGDSGYILYRDSDFAEGLNVATNYATAYGWLPVNKKIEAVAKNCGLTLKKDISEDEYDIAFQQKHWNELRDYFRKGLVIHERYSMFGLRDFAIQQNAYCFYTDSSAEGNKFLKKVLKWSGKNTAIMGWTEKEKHFVEFISKLGCYINPADYCANNSYLASFETEIPKVNCDSPVAYKDPTKHYVTLVFSDGDNCQWIQNGFGEYHQTVNNYPDIKMTWTFSPFFQEFNPIALKHTYETANENQYFIAGPSGIGYCNPTVYDRKSLDLMSTRTASAMLKSNQRILTILDDYTMLKEKKFAYRLGFFSRFDNIDGGIVFLDPKCYQSGEGKVWFSNGKPFASVRLSLWADGGYDGATDEWIKSQADTVNNYPVDINSVNGYSVICVHAWTMKPDAIQKFISDLDDHVVVLNAGDFIKTMKENVVH
ncbi:MAG: hypothetical protein KBT46_00050 [Ruminococcus sp.]|nr:hypothetical protein [Candidatus Copronaster equi]